MHSHRANKLRICDSLARKHQLRLSTKQAELAGQFEGAALNKELLKFGAKKWAALGAGDATAKAKYESLAAKAKQEYQVALEEWKKTDKWVDWKNACAQANYKKRVDQMDLLFNTRHKVPKRPLTAFMVFSQQLGKDGVATGGVRERAGVVKTHWDAAKKGEGQYVKLFKDCEEQANRDKEVYTAKMNGIKEHADWTALQERKGALQVLCVHLHPQLTNLLTVLRCSRD